MKRTILGSLLLATLATPLWAQEGGGGGGSGIRGGGHVIEVNGNFELVDIVTNATCDWFSGVEMKDRYTAIDQVLKKIEKLDWYLALELKREIEFISWCMTGNLYSVPANDNDSFVQQLTRGVQQAAFRYNENAYIDYGKFSSLNQNSQAYLVFHEVLHSYLPMNLEMRIFKLQSLVSTIRKVDLGQIKTRESLHLNLANNDMNFPLTVKKLEPYMRTIQFILGPSDDRISTILASSEPEKLIHARINEALPYVAPWDRAAIQQADKIIPNALAEIFRSDDLKKVQFVLNQQTYKKINPASVALTIYNELSAEVKKEVTTSSYFSQIIKEGADYLNEIKFSIFNGRIVGDMALQSLSGQCFESAPSYTTSLDQLSRDCHLPSKIQAIADIMVTLAETEDDEALEEELENNVELIQALRMEKSIEMLRGLNPPIAREKELALKVLKKIQAKLIDEIKTNVSAKLSKPSPVIERILKKMQ